MSQRNFIKFLFLAGLLFLNGCTRSPLEKRTTAPATMRDVPALKLSFRFEPDVPPPAETNRQSPAEEKNQAIQNDFDANRAREILERTVTSPDKQRVVAVYRKVEDLPNDYRADVYAPDGRLLRKITPNGMAMRFPDTIVWSPDSNNVALVAATRLMTTNNPALESAAPTPPAEMSANVDANSNVETNSAANSNANVAATPALEQPKAVLTFRTEQIYTFNREGADLKPLTQNEGLIYFYFVWSPDSSALLSLAATWREWQVSSMQAGQRGETFTPAGRPRVVERSGRERRLDDAATTVQPVWSPDSSKVAVAYVTDVRIYDAIGDVPTQAAVALRNPLLLSSKIYDDDLRRKEQSGDSNANVGANVNSNTSVNANLNVNANSNANTQTSAAISTDASALPDENLLVSFNPIIRLEWAEDKMLYAQTGFVREYRNQSENRYSYLRWHRLVFSPQATVIN